MERHPYVAKTLKVVDNFRLSFVGECENMSSSGTADDFLDPLN